MEINKTDEMLYQVLQICRSKQNISKGYWTALKEDINAYLGGRILDFTGFPTPEVRILNGMGGKEAIRLNLESTIASLKNKLEKERLLIKAYRLKEQKIKRIINSNINEMVKGEISEEDNNSD